MKRTLSFLILIISINGLRAQEPAEGIFPVKEGEIFFEEIVDVQADKLAILQRSKLWALSVFVSQKAALQMEDKDMGLLGYRTNVTAIFENPQVMGVKAKTEWVFSFSLKIYAKDNKAKIVLSDFSLQADRKNSILTYRAETEDYFKRSMMGKGYREKYYAQARNTFTIANAKLLAVIVTWKDAVAKQSEGDF